MTSAASSSSRARPSPSGRSSSTRLSMVNALRWRAPLLSRRKHGPIAKIPKGRPQMRPFGIFEMGPCFRRDSKGARHLNEFTMLNLVELGRLEGEGLARLDELAALVMSAAGVNDYRIVRTESEVYGEMADVEVNGAEVCSAAVGPNPLDGNWGIVEPWVGLGFGLERLIMVRDGSSSIERAGRSLTHVGGVPLTICLLYTS